MWLDLILNKHSYFYISNVKITVFTVHSGLKSKIIIWSKQQKILIFAVYCTLRIDFKPLSSHANISKKQHPLESLSDSFPIIGTHAAQFLPHCQNLMVSISKL